MIAIIFSKDRPLQLDATIRSLALRCRDLNLISLHVICMASAKLFADGYDQLRRELHGSVDVNWVAENDFKGDVLSLLQPDDHVLWLVDDNLFFADFSIAQARDALGKHPDSIGFSLRLGTNTSYCYPMDAPQRLPDFSGAGPGILAYRWPGADYDFGYPLEVSSSIYRTNDIIPLLQGLHFNNPNSLEAGMAQRAVLYRESHPRLLCFEKSVTFCNPVNKVQSVCSGNRAGSCEEFSAEQLARRFLSGYRIDLAVPDGFEPNACHQERDLQLFIHVFNAPMVSVIIPCYKQSQFLPDAVQSVIAQTFTDWECLIVNDGSPDTTSEVASALMAKHPHLPIFLHEKQNGGLADARNHGITRARGRYILPLDSDDILHPDMLAKTVAILENQPEAAIVYTDLLHFGAVEKHVVAGEYDFPTLKYANQLNYCSLYRREVWEQVGGYNTNMKWGYEDWDFWIGAGERGFFAVHLPEELLYYRVKHESMYTKALEHDAELKAQIVQNHPALYGEEERAWARKGLTPQHPRVSVIVPTHNRPRMLKEALQSILDQTFRDFEIIVVNDAGTDVSEIVQAFRSPAITYLSHEINKGLAAARNTGIRAARGKYIAYLDDDDIFYPEHLEILASYLEESGEKVAYTDAFRAHQRLENGRYVTYYKDIPYSCDFDCEMILYKNFVPVLCFMHEKSCLHNCGMFDETYARLEDWELWVRMSRHFPICHIRSITCEFRYRPDGSSMVSGSLVKFLDMTRMLYAKYPVAVDNAVQGKRLEHLFSLRCDVDRQLRESMANLDAATADDILASPAFERLLQSGAGRDMILSSFFHHLAGRQPDPGHAEEALKHSLKLDPTNYSARCTLCTILVNQNRLNELPFHLEQLLNACPESETINQLAAALEQVTGFTFNATRLTIGKPKQLSIAVFSLDLPEQACSQLRFSSIRGMLHDELDIFWGTYFDNGSSRFTAFTERADQADVIVLARLFPRKETASVVEKLFSLGKPVIYDIDDLLTGVPAGNPFKQQADDSTPFIEDIARRATLVTVSNRTLQQEMLLYNPHVAVLPNLLDRTLWPAKMPEHSKKDAVVIGYAGGFTHAEDIAMVEDALLAVAERYGERVKMRFLGCMPEKLRRLSTCDHLEPSSNYGVYAMKLSHAGFDIALAPLANNRFNCCKSNIKWLEYSACGLPGVFSDLPPYNTCIENGSTGLLVGNSTEDWVAALELLINDQDLRRSIARKAHHEVMTNWTLENGAHCFRNLYRSLLANPGTTMKCSIVIPVCNRLAFTQQCLEMLLADAFVCRQEIIVVDNGSCDATPAYLQRHTGMIKVISNEQNLGFAKACNQGVRAAAGRFVVFLNNDTIPKPGWLEALLQGTEEEKAAVVGAKLLYPDGTVQHAGVAFGREMGPYHIFNGFRSDDPAVNKKRVMQAVTAACMLVERELFLRLGGFDEEYLNGFEDVDFCLRAKQQGAWILYTPESELIHFESTSPGRKQHDDANLARFRQRWEHELHFDDEEIYRSEGISLVREANGQVFIERNGTP